MSRFRGVQGPRGPMGYDLTRLIDAGMVRQANLGCPVWKQTK